MLIFTEKIKLFIETLDLELKLPHILINYSDVLFPKKKSEPTVFVKKCSANNY